MQLAPVFLCALTGGMLLVLALAKVELIAWRFLRLTGLIAFGLLVLALVLGFRNPETGGRSSVGTPTPLVIAAIGAATASFLSPFSNQRPKTHRAICSVSGVLGLVAAWVFVTDSMPTEVRTSSMLPLIAVNLSSAAGLLGSITMAWLLGHAYLTATTMTIFPLQQFSRFFGWATAVRALAATLILATAWTLNSGDVGGAEMKLSGLWFLLLIRAGIGLAAVAVFAYMVAACVKLRATQSATGILYFGSVFAYIGELTGLHLTMEYGWPC